jgi:hypothetical protein
LIRNRGRKLAVLALTLTGVGAFGFGIAQAQPNTPPPPPDAATGLTRPVNVSLEDMQKQGEGTVARIEMTAGTVRKMLEKARSERDVIKTLCLNDKLNQLDVTLRSAKERMGGLTTAATRRDNDLAAHEFTVLGVYRARADTLASEAQLCIGNDVVLSGQTSVTTSVDPGIPEDYTGVPKPPDSVVPVIPPTCGSCDL